jgi:hypothetical protein
MLGVLVKGWIEQNIRTSIHLLMLREIVGGPLLREIVAIGYSMSFCIYTR